MVEFKIPEYEKNVGFSESFRYAWCEFAQINRRYGWLCSNRHVTARLVCFHVLDDDVVVCIDTGQPVLEDISLKAFDYVNLHVADLKN